MDKPLIIAHANCSDGFTSYWIAQRYFQSQGIECDYHPGIYGQDPPDVTGRTVYMLDFSYPIDMLSTMAYVAKEIIIIDHHKTAQKALGKLEIPNVQCIFDMSKSGAMLTYEYFYQSYTEGGQKIALNVPSLVHYVQDFDLFQKKLPNTDLVNLVIYSTEFNLDLWDCLDESLSDPIETINLLNRARSILGYKNKYINLVSKNVTMTCLSHKWGKFAGMYVPTINLSYWEISDILNQLCQDHPFAIGYFKRQDGRWQYSFRSTSFDVSDVAKEIGGGGHANAAGAESLELLI